jgi:hypothetical protein
MHFAECFASSRIKILVVKLKRSHDAAIASMQNPAGEIRVGLFFALARALYFSWIMQSHFEKKSVSMMDMKRITLLRGYSFSLALSLFYLLVFGREVALASLVVGAVCTELVALSDRPKGD